MYIISILTVTCATLTLIAILLYSLVSGTAILNESNMATLKPITVENLADSAYDVVIFVNDQMTNLSADFKSIEEALADFSKINSKLDKEVAVIPFKAAPHSRLIFSSTKLLDGDTDDSRNIYEAAIAGVKKALSIDCRKLLLVCGEFKTAPSDATWAHGQYGMLNAVLGAYQALYTPIEVREALPSKARKADMLAVFKGTKSLLDVAYAIEEGRRVARDIGGSDPERMAAPNIAEYIQKEFNGSQGITLSVEKVDEKKYPLMAAVNRAAAAVERHNGRVVKMTYEGKKEDEQTTLFLVGKGITFDTGGADVKANGVMAGMHRDKCGAAATAGFFKTLQLLAPPNLVVHGYMAYVRNSIGSEAYVADEIITARSGQRVRVGNTDAEGRMVMADLLCEAKENALNATNPFLFTIATLTGHVIRAYKDFAAVMDNGPARLKQVSAKLQAAGDKITDIAEISTVRREDFEFHKGQSEYEDLLQCNNLPSSGTPRGHQTPAAFMNMASGLHLHGRNSKKPLPYTHVDVAGAAGSIHFTPTASPLMMFTARYILPQLRFN